MDRRCWLESQISDGSSSSVKFLKRGRIVKHASIRNLSGDLVGMSDKAHTLADYLELVQWQVRFPELVPKATAPLGDTLPINVDAFSLDELHVVLKKLRSGKAPGADGIHAQFWKIISRDNDACAVLLQLCQRCWAEKDIPTKWRLARVKLL